jgi:hypothetical protein
MSKRKHSQNKPAWKSEIEWLNHREGYPNAAERTAIIEMREELSVRLIEFFIRKSNPNDPRYRAVIDQYGPQEVEMALDRMRDRMQFPRTKNEAHEQREYRQGFALFGADRPFHPAGERQKLYESRDDLVIQAVKERGVFLREDEDPVGQSLLIGWQNWADITPRAIPVRPSDYSCPAPGSYTPPVSELLDYGPNLEKNYDFNDPRWKKAIPALTRMALDPGLLEGWPGENASWAPWHAAHLLGLLEAWESAPALAELADMQSDWLSDHLPHIWADMGAEVLPTLWMLAEDPNASTKLRGLAAEALFMLAEEDEAMTRLVAKGFEKILKRKAKFDPTLNAYLISFLQDLEGAVGQIEDAIADAFEEGRVDEDFITFEDVLGDDEDFEDDEDD